MPEEMTPEEIAAELELRRRQLAAREGNPGYSANVAKIKERIAELEAMTNE